MSQENEPGQINTPGPTDVVTHLAIDRADPRWGHVREFGGMESSVRQISEAASPSPVPDPDASIHDPVVGINTRTASHPVWATIRAGFEDVPLLGKKKPEVSPAAMADPLQSMEASPTYERSTLRVTPGPWDEDLLLGRI